jgi:hypothetical protein
MKGILYVLFGGIVLGCSDRYLDDESLNTVKSEQVEAIRLADLSQTGIYGINGFIKQGNRLIVGPTYMQEGVAQTIDLDHPAGKVLSSKAVVSSKPFRTLSAFNSWDGKSVTALDFKTGELIENAVSPLTRGITETSVIQLPRDEQHLIAVKTNDFVISTGFYGEGRYLLYSLVDGSVRYCLSYPDCPDYPVLQEKTKGMLYASSILRLRPDGQAFVCADMYSGVIDFCRLIPGGIERVKLERLSYPMTEISETPVPRVLYKRENRFGFMDIAVTSERVYALYSGKTYERDRQGAFEGNRLLEYDWEGNLVRTLDFNVALTGITYDCDEGALYGIAGNAGVSLVKLRL